MIDSCVAASDRVNLTDHVEYRDELAEGRD